LAYTKPLLALQITNNDIVTINVIPSSDAGPHALIYTYVGTNGLTDHFDIEGIPGTSIEYDSQIDAFVY
jgi:hypothetical protein